MEDYPELRASQYYYSFYYMSIVTEPTPFTIDMSMWTHVRANQILPECDCPLHEHELDKIPISVAIGLTQDDLEEMGIDFFKDDDEEDWS